MATFPSSDGRLAVKDDQLYTTSTNSTWRELLSRGVAPAGSRAAGDCELVNNWPIGDTMSRVRRYGQINATQASKPIIIERRSAYHLTGLIGGGPAEASARPR